MPVYYITSHLRRELAMHIHYTIILYCNVDCYTFNRIEHWA